MSIGTVMVVVAAIHLTVGTEYKHRIHYHSYKSVQEFEDELISRVIDEHRMPLAYMHYHLGVILHGYHPSIASHLRNVTNIRSVLHHRKMTPAKIAKLQDIAFFEVNLPTLQDALDVINIFRVKHFNNFRVMDIECNSLCIKLSRITDHNKTPKTQFKRAIVTIMARNGWNKVLKIYVSTSLMSLYQQWWLKIPEELKESTVMQVYKQNLGTYFQQLDFIKGRTMPDCPLKNPREAHPKFCFSWNSERDVGRVAHAAVASRTDYSYCLLIANMYMLMIITLY